LRTTSAKSAGLITLRGSGLKTAIRARECLMKLGYF